MPRSRADAAVVRYTLARDTLPPVYACHCHLCQRWSGSAFSVQALLPEASMRVTGPVVTFEIATLDRVSTQHACGTCHARLWNINSRRPGIAVLRAGTLDRSEELECRAHIFTATRQRWVTIPEDVPSWLEGAEPAAFVALMMGA